MRRMHKGGCIYEGDAQSDSVIDVRRVSRAAQNRIVLSLKIPSNISFDTVCSAARTATRDSLDRERERRGNLRVTNLVLGCSLDGSMRFSGAKFVRDRGVTLRALATTRVDEKRGRGKCRAFVYLVWWAFWAASGSSSARRSTPRGCTPLEAARREARCCFRPRNIRRRPTSSSWSSASRKKETSDLEREPEVS